MKIAVCFNLATDSPVRGEQQDHISETGAALEAQAVAEALVQLGHRPVLIPLATEIDSFVAALQQLRPDVVFNLCEGFAGESSQELHVAALYELLGLAYTGSKPLTLGITQNKALTKDLLIRHGLPTPNYNLIPPDTCLPKQLKLNYPLIVKPCCEDASLSITHESVVTAESDLKRRLKYIHECYRQDALVEEFIFGREFNVSILGNNPGMVLPVAEICFEPQLKYPIVSYEGKWLEKSNDYTATAPVCPAAITDKEHRTIQQATLKAYQLFGCRDYARVDMRWQNGTPYILELNANPDISPDAGLARSAGCAGTEYPALISEILTMALARKGV